MAGPCHARSDPPAFHVSDQSATLPLAGRRHWYLARTTAAWAIPSAPIRGVTGVTSRSNGLRQLRRRLDDVYRLYGVEARHHHPPRSGRSPGALACAERWSFLVGAHPPWASPRCGKVLRKAVPSAHDAALFLDVAALSPQFRARRVPPDHAYWLPEPLHVPRVDGPTAEPVLRNRRTSSTGCPSG